VRYQHVVFPLVIIACLAAMVYLWSVKLLDVPAVAGLAVGSAVSIAGTWYVAWWYYRRSGEDLERAAGGLKAETERMRVQIAEVQDLAERIRTTLRSVAEVSGSPQLRPSINSRGDSDRLIGTRTIPQTAALGDEPEPEVGSSHSAVTRGIDS